MKLLCYGQVSREGPEPTEGVRDSATDPLDLEPIINALDDPMRVSYGD